MSKIYDNWERLVEAVLKREHLREIALQDSTSLSNASISSELWREKLQGIDQQDSRSLSNGFISSDFSFRLNSNFSTPDDLLSTHQHDHLNSANHNIVSSIREKPWEDQIVPIEGCSFLWNMVEMLNGTAETLGKGTLGGTHKVMLDERTTVVVKELKEVKITRWEFEQQIQFLGSIRHENIVAIIAYFYFKENKCLIYDFCKQSVGSMSHEKIGKKSRPLNWDTRKIIAIGTARGLAHIHAQRGGKLVHGNIKASNIFLNSTGYGCISDHCLVTINDVNEPPPMQSTGYLAPEITDFGQVSQESDVYSFGVLLLELLTRKCPDHAKRGKKVVGLVRWVNDVVSKKGTSKVFDSKLVKNPIMEEEMVKMLLLGMHCAATKPEQRPKMADILKMMECWER